MIRKLLAMLLLVSVVGTQTVSARRKINDGAPNQIHADNKLYHFGFILGLNMLDFNPSQSGEICDDGRIWYGDAPNFGVGFTIGMIADLRLAEYLNLRLTPELYFGERTLRFMADDGTERPNGDISIRSNIVSIPLLLKLRAQRMKNARPFLLAGFAAQFGVGRDKEAPIMLNMLDYGVEVGVGCDIYLPYFKLCPEFKVFFGLRDVLNRNRPDIADIDDLKYTSALNKLTSRIFAISFNFE